MAEGFGKQAHSEAEFRRFLSIALGSADEMRMWCRHCFDLGYIDAVKRESWRDEYQEIAKMPEGLNRRSRAQSDR